MADSQSTEKQMYRCYYTKPSGFEGFVDTALGVWFGRDGFWIDRFGNHTVAMDECEMWIPPHRITHITKLPRAAT